MDEFDVVILSFEGERSESPAEGLTRVFGIPAAAADKLLERLPAAVQRGVPVVRAEYFRKALTSIGAQVEVRGADGQLLPAPAQEPERPRPKQPSAPLEPTPVLSAELHATDPAPPFAGAPLSTAPATRTVALGSTLDGGGPARDLGPAVATDTTEKALRPPAAATLREPVLSPVGPGPVTPPTTTPIGGTDRTIADDRASQLNSPQPRPAEPTQFGGAAPPSAAAQPQAHAMPPPATVPQTAAAPTPQVPQHGWGTLSGDDDDEVHDSLPLEAPGQDAPAQGAAPPTVAAKPLQAERRKTPSVKRALTLSKMTGSPPNLGKMPSWVQPNEGALSEPPNAPSSSRPKALSLLDTPDDRPRQPATPRKRPNPAPRPARQPAAQPSPAAAMDTLDDDLPAPDGVRAGPPPAAHSREPAPNYVPLPAPVAFSPSAAEVDARSFWESVTDALALPFQGAGVFWLAAITMWGVAVGLFAGFIPMPMAALAMTFVALTSLVAFSADFCRVCLWTVVTGEGALVSRPEVDPVRILSVYIKSGFNLTLFWLVSYIPVIWWMGVRVTGSDVQSMGEGAGLAFDIALHPVTWALAVLPSLYWPMGVGLSGLNNSFGSIWNVAYGMRVMARAPTEYLAIAVIGSAAFVISSVSLTLFAAAMGVAGPFLASTAGFPIALSHGIIGALFGHLVRARPEIFD